jgi:hypothetical protein
MRVCHGAGPGGKGIKVQAKPSRSASRLIILVTQARHTIARQGKAKNSRTGTPRVVGRKKRAYRDISRQPGVAVAGE